MSYENPWLYENKIFESEAIDNYIGFVYIITNLTDNKKYIGKKLFGTTKTRQVNKKKKRYKVESDWKEYYGSSESLLTDVDKYGRVNFKREIIRLCKSKGECSYFEAKEQFAVDAVIDPCYYNSWISVRVRRSHLKL
jgi:hypothetical protein